MCAFITGEGESQNKGKQIWSYECILNTIHLCVESKNCVRARKSDLSSEGSRPEAAILFRRNRGIHSLVSSLMYRALLIGGALALKAAQDKVVES